MATYVIGDVHGCYQALLKLFELIELKASDTIIFIGDLVGKGKQEWEVLALAKQRNALILMGNHDLHFLAIHSKPDNFKKLSAAQQDHLAYYLKAKFAYWHQKTDSLLVHAGVWPEWSLQDTLAHAKELEKALLSWDKLKQLAGNMYGNKENKWLNTLTAWPRYRCMINIFTRMRCITEAIEMDLSYTGDLETLPQGSKPWYLYSKIDCQRVIFGHWSALRANSRHKKFICIDQGYIWGGALQAFRLEDAAVFRVYNDEFEAN